MLKWVTSLGRTSQPLQHKLHLSPTDFVFKIAEAKSTVVMVLSQGAAVQLREGSYAWPPCFRSCLPSQEALLLLWSEQCMGALPAHLAGCSPLLWWGESSYDRLARNWAWDNCWHIGQRRSLPSPCSTPPESETMPMWQALLLQASV